MKQSHQIYEFEADAWYKRNKQLLGTGHDPVASAIEDVGIVPNRVMEIGCSNGWRLAKLKENYGCDTIGVEPGRYAAQYARRMNGVGRVFRMTAERLPLSMTAWADMLIYGFCLYLTDPEDWAHIVAEGSRVLRDDGHLIVYDFRATTDCYAKPYEHSPGMLSYHFDFASLWLANPLFTIVRRITDEDSQVTVIKKHGKESVRVVK